MQHVITDLQHVITEIEIKQENRKEFEEIIAKLRKLAAKELGPVWSFVETKPVVVKIGGAKLI